MPHADFVHLRVHSAYSLAEAAIHVKDLAKLCVEYSMPALALTDSDNLFGALEFSEVMAASGVQPIIGCALALESDRTERRNGAAAVPERLMLLAKNETGYQNLIKLCSVAHLGAAAGDEPQLHLDDLEARNDGLICFTGGPEGPLCRLLLDDQRAQATALLGRLEGIFSDRLYVEIQRHGSEVEGRTEAALLELADSFDLPLIATNDVHFAEPEMHEAHDVLLCIEQGVTVGERERRRVTPEHRFKSASEMRVLFADLPEAVDNTLVVARRCAWRVPTRAPILPRFAATDGPDEPTLLRKMATEGLERRLDDHVFQATMSDADRQAAATPYREGLAFELGVIIDMGFAGYFLIVADFIQWAKHERIPVGPGRGSGAGSLVSWALQITDLDPLRFGLLFERFLNPERVSMPDFDIDFCQEQRDRVIRYVQDKYGHDQVAQIITFGKLQARAALRDVGRVLAMPYGQVDKLCKLVPYNPANPLSLRQALEAEPRLEEARRSDPAVERLIDVAMKLEGLYRHASTHAAGVVIGDRPLDELVPLYRDPRSDMPVTQFNMKWVEPAGLVKFDFLGLKTLTVLDRAVKQLAAQGIALDLERLPLDDPRTYEILRRGEAIGIFQFEGSGMRDLLIQAEPSNIEDLIALVALYRPGPMENIPKYIACKHGRERPEFLHETIEPVVKDTYGVIIYQEQVMQIAQVFAGYDLGQADLLRRAMGKKIKSEMQAQRDVFIQGAMARNVDQERAAYVFDLVDKFAGYGFNKAHSAGYALLAYQTAYLKANHPVAFLAASMTLDMGNTDKLNVYRQEFNRLAIALLPPDVNRSDVEFMVDESEDAGQGNGAIRYALAAIKNVGREAMRALVEERRGNGSFKDIWDFARRMDHRQINKRQLENLVRAGAFDSLLANRAQVMAAVDLMLRYANQASIDRESHQVSLFADVDGEDAPAPPRMPALAEWSAAERLAEEFDAVGFYLSAHPLDAYRAVLRRARVISHSEVADRLARGGSYFKVAGTVLRRQERNSARGNRYAFLQLSDASGMYEVTVFSELLAANRDVLEPGRSLILEVEARADGDQARLSVQNLTDIAEMNTEPTGVRVFVRDPEPLESIRSILEPHVGGRADVRLLLSLDASREVEMSLPGRFAMTAAIRGAIKAVSGVVDVHEV